MNVLNRSLALSAPLRNMFRVGLAKWEIVRPQTSYARILSLAFPGHTPSEIKQLAHRHIHARFEILAEQRRLAGMTAAELSRFVERCDVVGLENVQGRPCVIASPHFGYYALAALKLGRLFKDEIRVFYNPPDRNPFSGTMTALFENLQMDDVPLMNDRKGVVQAVRRLNDGGIVGVMPDFVTSSTANAFVPFFGRFYQTMTGTAYFALKAGAAIVPLYCERKETGGFRIVFESPIQVEQIGNADHVRDQLYAVSCLIYARMENIIARRPEHWMFWRDYETFSVSLPSVPVSVKHAIEACRHWSEALHRARDPFADVFDTLLNVEGIAK